MSEQQIVDAALELSTWVALLSWHLTYAFDRGKLQTCLTEATEVNARLQAKLQEALATHSGCEAKYQESAHLLDEVKKIMMSSSEFARSLKQQNTDLAKENHKLNGQLVKLSVKEAELREASRKITKERDALAAWAEIVMAEVQDMSHVIYDKHLLRFEKALRQIPFVLNVSMEEAEFDVMKDIY